MTPTWRCGSGCGPSPGFADESPGEMGAVTTIAVTLASTGTLTALAHALEVWLIQRRSDITLTVNLPDGRDVTLDAQRIQPGQAERLLLAASAQPPGLPADTAQPPAARS